MVPGLVSHLDLQWQQTAYRRFVRALEQGTRVIGWTSEVPVYRTGP